MEELLLLLIQGFFDLLIFVFTAAPIELAMYLWEKDEDNRTFLKCFFLLLLGLAFGGVSVMLFPKSMISRHWLRIVVTLAVPIVTGCVSRGIAEYLSRRKDDVWPRRHFWYSFSICLGYVIVRFVGCTR